MRKKIFGYNIEIKSDESESILYKKLIEALKYYEESFTDDIDIEINLLKIDKFNFKEYKLINPKVYYYDQSRTAICISDKIIEKKLLKNRLCINIYLEYNTPKTIFNFLRKIISYEFKYSSENFPQFFYEMVLIPIMCFEKERALIHCSSIACGNKIIFLGGTGGVGKTSTLIELGREKKVSFVCDDILVIDKENFYENYAYPKIYAYNTIGDKKLEQEILKKEGILSKLHWMMMKKINPARVRRKILPEEFYKIKDFNKKNMNKIYIILSRGNYEKMQLKSLERNNAKEITKHIILTEYKKYIEILNYEIINKILYNEYIDNQNRINCILENWDNIYDYFFNNTDTYILEVPKEIEHFIFKKNMKNILKQFFEGN